MRKGDIYLVDLGNGVGSEQEGTRPCVVIQGNKGNRFSTTTIVCPTTTSLGGFNKTHLDVELEKPSTVLVEQMRVIDNRRIKRFLGRLSNEEINKINELINLTLDL